MIRKEVVGSKEIRYIEKEIEYNLFCDVCGKKIFSGDSKERLHEKEKEIYRIAKPIYGKTGVEGEETTHLCGSDCYDKFIKKEFKGIANL